MVERRIVLIGIECCSVGWLVCSDGLVKWREWLVDRHVFESGRGRVCCSRSESTLLPSCFRSEGRALPKEPEAMLKS